MKNKKTVLILTVFITFILLGNMSFAQEQDCPIGTCTDVDGDGYIIAYPPDCNENPNCGLCKCGDCDDTMPYGPAINPGMTEICDDNLDNNCNNLYDCHDAECCGDPKCLYPPDDDGDGYTVCDGDCDDTMPYGPAINPGMTEICGDNLDNNCNNLYDCKDPECAGQTRPDGDMCCLYALDCTQDDCIIESCENNICTYTDRPKSDTTECSTCEGCDSKGGNCISITSDSGKNCNEECTKCESGECINRNICDAAECSNQERCDSSGGDCADPDSNSNVCDECYNGFFDETVHFEAGTNKYCCNDDTGEYYTTQGVGTGACCNSPNDCVDTNNMCREEYPNEVTCNNNIDDDCDKKTDCKDEDCANDPACSDSSCAPEEDTCKNTKECCDDLKCKRQIDSRRNKICCNKNDCASTEGCIEENTCKTINYKNRKKEVVCVHGWWRPETRREWRCNDKTDNDCDGKIDCNDPDCKYRSYCKPKCTTSDGCNSKETCKNGICTRLFCKGCAYPEDHTCKDWECCTRKDCSKGEICWRHECMTPPKSTSMKNRYTKENAKSAIETAQQNILQKKFSGDKPKNIKRLELELKNAKTAYDNGEYEKSESIADEITTGKKQKESVVDKIKGFMNRVKSFFMSNKENKPYIGSNIMPKI